MVKKRKRTNVLSKEKSTANQTFENAAQYTRKDHQESYRLCYVTMETIRKNAGGFVINGQEEKTDQCLIQGEGNSKPLL